MQKPDELVLDPDIAECLRLRLRLLHLRSECDEALQELSEAIMLGAPTDSVPTT